MDLLNSIPAPIWGLAVIAFAFWYMFMRGRKKRSRKSLNRLRREEEATKRELNIARNREKIQEVEEKKREKARKRQGDPLKW